MSKAGPKVFHILAKSHKMTIFLNAPVATTIGDLKAQALTGLVQFAKTDEDVDMPFPHEDNDAVSEVTTVSQFELCRARRERGEIVEFEILDTKSTVRAILKNWEVIYFKFRNAAGKLQNVQVEEPVDDEEDIPSPSETRGKRKQPLA